MGESNSSPSRRETAVSAIAEKASAGVKLAEQFDFVQLDIYTGYMFTVDENSGKLKANETKDPRETVQAQHGVTLNIVRCNEQLFVSLIGVVPVEPEKIIDKNYDLFDYDHDSLFNNRYTSIERHLTGERKQLEKAITELALESQRVMLLYGDKG